MRALVLRAPEQLEVTDVPKLPAGPGQLQIRVTACGICGSDIRYFFGENPWAKQTLGQTIPNPPNIILGHEFMGVVEDAYAQEDRLLIGRRVAVNTFITCGECQYCRAGQENLCPKTRHYGHGQGWPKMEFYPGGMAEFCAVPRSQVYELPESLTDHEATFLDPLIASLHAVDVGAPKCLDKVAVYGAGPIGNLIAQIAKAFGAVETFICDVAEENVAAATKVGVDHAINVSRHGNLFREAVQTATHGQGVELAFDTVGTEESITQSLGILKKGGVLVLMATKDDEVRFPSLLLTGERAIQTSANARYADFPRAMELLARKRVQVLPLISHRFPLSRALEAFDVACHKSRSGAIKIILECQS
jgi:2-desacetyl-2-hydroxyethyl bacteriochlorophyllide A dehydrogenase